MAYDYSKLNGRIVEKCGTRANFAEMMGLSERTISLKLNNKISFKQPEIQKALSQDRPPPSVFWRKGRIRCCMGWQGHLKAERRFQETTLPSAGTHRDRWL